MYVIGTDKTIRRLLTLALILQDDVFLLGKMTGSDVATPLLGPVFRIQKDLFVEGQAPDTLSGSREGEWPGLMLSNWMLGACFFGGREQSVSLLRQVL